MKQKITRFCVRLQKACKINKTIYKIIRYQLFFNTKIIKENRYFLVVFNSKRITFVTNIY